MLLVCVSLYGVCLSSSERERERGGYIGSNKNTRHTSRPNIVVKECNAYDEDKWRTIIIRDLRYARIHIAQGTSYATYDTYSLRSFLCGAPSLFELSGHETLFFVFVDAASTCLPSSSNAVRVCIYVYVFVCVYMYTRTHIL